MASAQQLAQRYEQYVAILVAASRVNHWGTGMRPAREFMVWIEAYWRDDASPEPATSPAATSPDGWGGTIRWYETGRAVLGYGSDGSGCYQVPIEAAPPPISAPVLPAS